MVASCVFTVLTLSSAADRFWVKGGEDIDGLGGEAGEMQVGSVFQIKTACCEVGFCRGAYHVQQDEALQNSFGVCEILFGSEEVES